MSLVRPQRPRGFTLIDLLVVLAVVGFLVGLLVVAVQRVREAAARMQCTNNLRQLALAVHNMDSVYNQLPPTVGPLPQGAKNYGTLFFHALPFLEQDNLYKQAQGYVWRHQVSAMPVPVFLCPSDGSGPASHRYQGRLAVANYAANWQMFGTGGRRLATVTDGLSNTIMNTERYQLCKGTPCAWGYPVLYYWAPMFAYFSQAKFQTTPEQPECDPARAQSPHRAGINVGMGDGSARFVAETVSPQTWWYACTPAGGEALGDDW